MEKTIITISREFGSGGRYIGKQVAQKLGIAFYDKDIIGRAAEETGLSKEFIEKKGEYSPIKSIFAYSFVGRNSTGASLEDYLYSVQRKIILEITEKESCVIVGRCADYILKDRKDSIHLFICGNEKEKIERIEKLYQKTGEEAVKLMREMDKKRSINYKYYAERQWGRACNYTMTLNSSKLGYEKCIDIIMDVAR